MCIYALTMLYYFTILMQTLKLYLLPLVAINDIKKFP